MGKRQQLKPRPSVVLFIGPPLSGKDEMVKHLSQAMAGKDIGGTTRHISVVKTCGVQGGTIPEEIITELMTDEIRQSMLSRADLTVINGYPQSFEQAQDLIRLLQKHGIYRPICVHLAGTYELLSERLYGHLHGKKDAETTFDEVMDRWENYRRSCDSLIPYLRQTTQYVEIDPNPADEKKRKNSLYTFAEIWSLIGHHVTELQLVSA